MQAYGPLDKHALTRKVDLEDIPAEVWDLMTCV